MIGVGRASVARGPSGSVVTELFAEAPVVLRVPRSLGDAAWVMAGTLGGGFVRGDDVALRVAVAEGASMWLGTQAATKVYVPRNGVGCTQSLDVSVARDALFVSWPDPIACFDQARFKQVTRAEVAKGGALVIVETLAAGRVSRGERWAMASYASVMSVTYDGALVVDERLRLDRADGSIGERLGRFDAVATIVFVGPDDHPARSALLAAGDGPITKRGAVVTAASPIDHGVVVRVAAERIDGLAGTVRHLLVPVSEALGGDPFTRRV